MTCPICGKPQQQTVRPFCSKRCADIDLGRWMGEAYSLPSQDPEDMAEAAEAFEQWLTNPASGEETPH